MLLARFASNNTVINGDILSNFIGWQFVVVACAVIGTLGFLTYGISMSQALFGKGGSDLAPYGKYQKAINISSAFFALIAAFSVSIITNQLAVTVPIVLSLLIFWTFGVAVFSETVRRRKIDQNKTHVPIST